MTKMRNKEKRRRGELTTRSIALENAEKKDKNGIQKDNEKRINCFQKMGKKRRG